MANIWRLPDQASFEKLQKRLRPRHVRLLHQTPAAPTAHPERFKLQKRQDQSYYSRELARQIRLASLPSAILEYPFAKDEGRKWCFDLAWPSLSFAVEVEGGVHRIEGRFASDLEKYNAAVLKGWRLIRVSTRQVKSGEALTIIGDALARVSAQ